MLHIDFTLFQSINLSIAAGVSCFALLYLIGKFIFTWPLLDIRLDDVRTHYGTMNYFNIKTLLNKQLFQRRKKSQAAKGSLMKRIFDSLIRKPFLSDESMKVSFEQAGWSAKNAQGIFIISKIFTLLIGLVVGYFIIEKRAAFTQASINVKMLIFILTSLTGWLIPDFYLKGVIRSRVELIEKQFPDALDLIIICLQAGLSLNRAIERVAKEMTQFGKAIAHELMITNVELEIMLDRRQALQNLYARVPSTMIRTFTTTVLQSIQQGTPTLQALDVLSKEIRDKRMSKAETKAAKLPSLMVIPLVLFVMPNLFIVLLGPAIVKLLNAT